MTRHSETREEQALNEIASTQVSSGTALFLVVAFLAMLGSVPVWQEFRAPEMDGPRPDIEAILPSSERLLPSVAELRTFEDDLETESFLRAALLAPVQALLCRLGAGNEQVYLGSEGWLFYRADVDHVTGAGFLEPAVLARRRREGDESTAAPEPDPLVGLLDMHAQLQARGVELIVVPTPLKPSVHPEYLSGDGGSARVDNPSTAIFERRLNEAGIVWVDLASTFAAAKQEEPLYLATDTHWTPEGMSLAAEAIARAVRDMLPATSGARYARTERTVANFGDITRMLELEYPERLYPDEEARIQEVHETRSVEVPARVLFLGDSFANIYSQAGMKWGKDAGLCEQLRFALQESIDAIRINDNGSFATRQALRRELVQGNDLLAGKRVVIYQFAARELSQGNWRSIEFPDVEATPESATKSKSPIHVTGVVRAVAPVPRPGTVAYRDALTSIHLVDVKATPALPTDEILVFRFGMCDGAWTSAARLQSGDKLELELVPWESASATYAGYKRVELNDEALWELATYWAPLDASEARAPSDAPPETWDVATLGDEEVHEGSDGWLFFGPEFRHMAAGEFWGEAARTAALATDPDLRDPLPAILDFDRQLKGAGIELWVVPVPPKAAVYPEFAGLDTPADELARNDQRFLELLKENGLHVLDLVSLFRADKGSDPRPLFCKQDTHWSPRACELVARQLARELAPYFADTPRRDYQRERLTIDIEGDLERRLKRADQPKESLELSLVKDGTKSIQPWRESPLLLLGDSHTLVFHAGDDLLAKGAGLPEQLTYELGFPPDLVGVRGSGSTAARISLFRRRDNLEGKRVVVWVFAARELTQSLDGWRKVPVIRD